MKERANTNASFDRGDVESAILACSKGGTENLLSSTFELTPAAIHYPGLTDNSIASLPLEALYKCVN